MRPSASDSFVSQTRRSRCDNLPTLLLLHVNSGELVQTAKVLTFEPAFDRRVAGEYGPVPADMSINVIKVSYLGRKIAWLVNTDFKDAFHNGCLTQGQAEALQALMQDSRSYRGLLTRFRKHRRRSEAS